MTDDEVKAIADEIANLCCDRRNNNRRLTALRDTLANEFARRNSWRRSKAWDALHKQWGYGAPVDHVNLWRTMDGGFALTSHVYGFANKEDYWRRAHDAFAPENLRVGYEVVADFPSWWNPGSTTLIVWHERRLA